MAGGFIPVYVQRDRTVPFLRCATDPSGFLKVTYVSIAARLGQHAVGTRFSDGSCVLPPVWFSRTWPDVRGLG